MWHQSAIFENSWPPFCQIWIIFTHLKLWIASARHNFKWVKIQIESFGGERVKTSYYIPENRPNFLTTRGFRIKNFMKLAYKYIAIFFNFSTILNNLHSLHVENWDSNSRLVVDEDDKSKLRLEKVNNIFLQHFNTYVIMCPQCGDG